MLRSCLISCLAAWGTSSVVPLDGLDVAPLGGHCRRLKQKRLVKDARSGSKTRKTKRKLPDKRGACVTICEALDLVLGQVLGAQDLEGCFFLLSRKHWRLPFPWSQ